MATQPDKSTSETIKARVAVVFAAESDLQVLRDCFRQFEIDFVEVQSIEQLRLQKIEGCVVGLDHPEAGKALETVRNSPSNLRAVLYGIEQKTKAAAQYLRYGVSVVLSSPLDRIAVIKAIRSTRALLLNEFRRYVRIPIAVEISVDANTGLFSSYTEEISGGGLSFHVPKNVKLPSGSFRVVFSLPNSSKIQINVTVCWSSEQEHMVGVRFEPSEPGREVVRAWVDEYLQLK